MKTIKLISAVVLEILALANFESHLVLVFVFTILGLYVLGTIEDDERDKDTAWKK